jgi:peptidoglycan/xylan/chitin deacetylase (PgdA/CDA1 family)
MKKVILFCLTCGVVANGFAQILKGTIPDKLVVLTFDDAPVTHFTYVAPLLKQYGFKATFFVCEFPPNFQDSTKYMTWNQIKRLGEMGFEIGNHTHTHKPVNGLEKHEFLKQLNYIEDKCKALNTAKPVTFAYPNYEVDQNAFSVLKNAGYAFARAGGNRAYSPLTDHPYLIPSYTITGNNFEQITQALRQAKPGEIVVLTFHGVPDYEHPWVSTPPEMFKKYLQYLYDNHYKVLSLKDLCDFISVKNARRKIMPDFDKPLKN